MIQFLLVLLMSFSLVRPALAQDDVDKTIKQTLEQVRTLYPANWTHADRGTFLNTAAYLLTQRVEKMGLLRKPGGNRCPTPQKVDVSCDYLVRFATMEGFDVLADENRPHWPGFGNPSDIFRDSPQRFLEAVAFPVDVPLPDPVPEPDPVVTPAPVDLGPILAKLNALEQLHEEVVRQIDALNHQNADLNLRLVELAARPAPPKGCRATVLGIRVACHLE